MNLFTKQKQIHRHRKQTYGCCCCCCISRIRLCATPQTAAHQAPPSLGFSRQEHWSGLPFPLQCMKVKSESGGAQSCPTLSDPMDCSPPGSSVRGIFQARVLEWGAIAFSQRGKMREINWDTQQCVYVNPNLLIYPSLYISPLVNRKFVFYVYEPVSIL